ncbi:putative barnase/colicin E5 family endoribonuclease [Helicobacter felis]|uniref:putative barnase/colicin E5 family endoribonuclease n=1 Tax=Helicobacter felis TaxID=214 RepID=UPI001F1FBBE2|nr:PBECR2 nuclease fold domain-containing protein [Helicobacter felis]
MPLKDEPSPSSAEPDKGGGEGGELPTKSTLAEDLSPAEIKNHIEQWDLTNPKATDRLLIGKVEGKELEQLSQEFKFNGNYALARQIDAQHVAHALNRHGDLKVETSRNQIPITLEDISNYPNIVKSADIREVEGNNIIYKKQINGHYVVVEEALTKKNKISFVTMWKGKGDLTTLPTPSSKGYDLDRTLSESYKDSNHTTPTLKNQATELFNTAKEQEAGFRELLEGLKGPSSSLEATNTLKSLESIQEKLEYYKGDTSKINDTLRGAVLTDKQAFDSQFMRVLENLENNPNTTNITPNFIKTQDGYQGVHINFDFNGVTSELQIHTPKSWAVKKKLDPLYKAKRRLQLEGNLSRKEAKELRRKMKNLAQESDLDSNLFTSLKLTSPQESPHQSVVVKNSLSDLNATQEPPLNSKAGSSSASGNAYNRLDSKLNQKSTSLTGGKGIDIQAPLDKNSTQGLKDKPLLLTYKNTQELVTHAKAEGLSPARIGQLVQERKQAITGLLPFKREADINSVIFKEDIKNNAQIVLEGRQAYLSHAQLLQALGKAKELRSTSPSAHTLVQHKQSRLAQLQDNTLAHQWLEAFNLKSLDEPFIPQFSPAVQQALEPILKGEQIQLTRGSLVKLEKRQREEFLPLIRPTLESPNLILDDGQGLLFIKEFIDPDKNRYFMSVAKNYSGEWVFSSHTKRQPSAIKSKIRKSKVLYNAGFSGGEVAGASDILESGGTAIKPSDLQINTPPSHSSALNPAKPEFSTPALKGKRARYLQMIQEAKKEGARDYKAFGGSTYFPEFSPQVEAGLEGIEKLQRHNLYLDLDQARPIYYRWKDDIVDNQKVGTLEKEASIIKETLANPSYVLRPNKKQSPLSFVKQEGNNSFFVVEMSQYGSGRWHYGRVNLEELSAYRKTHSLTKALPGFDLPPKPKITRNKSPQTRVKKLQEALIQNFLYDYKESGNETLISQLKNFLNDEDFIRTLPKKTLLGVEHGLARENPHIVRENLENIEQIASEIEKLDPKGVTPDMRRVIAHMEELNVRQEKELLEIKGLYEELVGKWEKMHGEKSGALFPERYTVGNKSKETDLPTKSNLKEFPLKNIEPNHAFGENFKEFEGKGAQAVAKLLKEKHGQVAGAFYREDLGYIDLVWGDSKKGLVHILERRTQQYGEQQALEFIHNLPRMLQEAKFYKELENKIELVTPTDMIVLGKRGDNKFVLTGFKDRRSKDRFKELENPQTRDDVGFTGKSVSEPQTKDDVLLPNQDNNTKPPLKKDKPRGKEITPDIKWHLTHFSAGAKAKLLRKDFSHPSMFAPSYLNLSPQATKALQPLLKGGKLEYAFESVHQLIRHHTEQYPYMQMALEAPDIILKDKKDALTFVKEFQETTYSIRLVKNAQNQKWHVKNAMPSDSKALQAMVKDGGQVLLGKNLLKALKVGPNPAFGENFGEFAGNGTEAVKKLLQEKRGQVAGAFYREDLGYIDLVWGAVKDEKGKIKGHGLSKILEKHLGDFKDFEGATPLEKLGNGINEIMRSGEVVKQEGDRIAIIQKSHHKTFRIGLKNNWKGEPTHNHWIITAYYDKREP